MSYREKGNGRTAEVLCEFLANSLSSATRGVESSLEVGENTLNKAPEDDKMA
jgi:hypothetical protein